MARYSPCPNKGCKNKCTGRECLPCIRKREAQARAQREAEAQERRDALKREAQERRDALKREQDARREAEANRPAPEVIAEDRERIRLQAENQRLKRIYNEALSTIDQYERDRMAMNVLSEGLAPVKIEPQFGDPSKNEGTVVAVASDWHVEERVDPRKVNGLNEYSIDIATERSQKFFRSLVRLVKLLQQDLRIDNLVLALLGDFITNQIHEEMAENNELTPTHALVEAQNMIIAGIEYILDNTALELKVPCHTGNHGRTTKTSRFGSENGHSLEFLMYLHLAAYFRNEPRIKFIIPAGPHSFMDVYNVKLRFHHGHMIKYAGGVGGFTIPVNKAIAQWNVANKVDIDVFGHFHQQFDGGNFICNGSLIGYNAFALSIKAKFERPSQAMFLIDKKRGKTCNWPILFTK